MQGFDRPLYTGHGGAREGAGRKGYEKSEDQKNLDTQKARHEKVKADLAELEYRERVGELVTRAAVKQAVATLLQTLAQGLRTVPDVLERQHAVAPEIAEVVGREIDDALEGLAKGLEMFTGYEPPPATDDDAA